MKQLEDRLAEERRALDVLLSRGQLGPETHRIREEILRLERAVAAARGEPHAIEWPLGSARVGIASVPLFAGDALSFIVMFDTAAGEAARPALYGVVFELVWAHKLTNVNDEVVFGHPLHGRGLCPYGAFVVKQSPWLRELEEIHSVHPQYDPAWWRRAEHRMIFFKDCMLEVISERVDVRGPFADWAAALQFLRASLTVVGREPRLTCGV